MERNCPKMDDFPDDDISDEKLFLELLSDDEYKSDKAENVFDRTEDLDEGIKNMFDDLGIPVEDVVGSDEELKVSVIDLVSSSSFSSSSSSSLMKTKCKPTSVLQHKSEPTSSKMRALSDSDFRCLRLLRTHPFLQVMDYENNDPGKYSTLPVPTYIFPNQSSSCVIDASFELLLNAVLPFVDMSFADQSNVYDSLLVNAYESYSQQSHFGIRAATLTVRQFVWNMTEYKIVSGAPRMVKTFPKGHEGDTHDLASNILQRLSGAFASKICTFPSLQCERKVSCSVEKAHAYARDAFFEFIYMIPTTIVEELRDCRGFINEAALDVKFNDLFREKVLKEHQKGKCNFPGCDGVSTSLKVLPQDDQFPEFLFIQEGANFVPGRTAGDNVYLSTYIHISQNLKYKLHGRVYSTCYDDIDNWKQQQMKVLTSDIDVAERLLKDISNTVYACYRICQIRK
ncbi:Ras- protein Rab-18 [Mucor velutinosus]|uniref:Ras- protein Rab-18 n=1 Tax=Mucor velutinosus TaxID=708070 RepID=A0AAN7HYU4_9FUNG|nr:Ras- protein Rab-18 [Mucor velutinosus]